MFQIAIGSSLRNQSSLLNISRAPPAVTPGQLSSDFITACTPRSAFPDTTVLLYASLCCLLTGSFKHPVVLCVFYRAATVAHCGSVVTWITWDISNTWTQAIALKWEATIYFIYYSQMNKSAQYCYWGKSLCCRCRLHFCIVSLHFFSIKKTCFFFIYHQSSHKVLFYVSFLTANGFQKCSQWQNAHSAAASVHMR